MGPEEDIWPLSLAEVLGDPLLQGFILVFCVGFLLLISPSQVATCCNCYKKGTWKGLQDPRGPGVHLATAGCHPCSCREMEKSLVQGTNRIGYCRDSPWAAHSLPVSSLSDTAHASVEGRDGVGSATLTFKAPSDLNLSMIL